MNRLALTAVACSVLCLLAGCPKPVVVEMVSPPEYDRPLPEGQLALRLLTDPANIPDFTPACENLADLRAAIDRSLDYLAKPSSRQFFPYGQVTHEQAVASLKAFADLVDLNLPASPMNRLIREKFDVYVSVGWDMRGTVLFTGYYTPIFDGSPVRTARFRCPLYRPPDNLVKAEDGRALGLTQPDGSLLAVPDRRGLETSGILAGKELVWLADPFEAYIAHVQGSVLVRMPDGQVRTIGYAANNGQEYRSIGKELVKDGKIKPEELSLATMIRYFRTHPQEVGEYVRRNPRFVFFTEAGGPARGSLNEPVTAFRSIATDKSIFPRACLAFISTDLPERSGGKIEVRPYRGFALDQDTGGAIRAPGRCDVYMGVGEAAGELAGRTMREGKLYYLFLKPAHVTPPGLQPMTQTSPAKPPDQP